jgi:hypothetical protein
LFLPAEDRLKQVIFVFLSRATKGRQACDYSALRAILPVRSTGDVIASFSSLQSKIKRTMPAKHPSTYKMQVLSAVLKHTQTRHYGFQPSFQNLSYNGILDFCKNKKTNLTRT